MSKPPSWLVECERADGTSYYHYPPGPSVTAVYASLEFYGELVGRRGFEEDATTGLYNYYLTAALSHPVDGLYSRTYPALTSTAVINPATGLAVISPTYSRAQYFDGSGALAAATLSSAVSYNNSGGGGGIAFFRDGEVLSETKMNFWAGSAFSDRDGWEDEHGLFLETLSSPDTAAAAIARSDYPDGEPGTSGEADWPLRDGREVEYSTVDYGFFLEDLIPGKKYVLRWQVQEWDYTAESPAWADYGEEQVEEFTASARQAVHGITPAEEDDLSDGLDESSASLSLSLPSEEGRAYRVTGIAIECPDPIR